MRKIEKQKLQQRSSIREHLPRLSSTSDAPVKLILIVIYLLGGILVWQNQQSIAASAENINYISPVAVYAMEHIFGTYITVGGIIITILTFIPLDKKNIQDQLRTIGFVNHADMVPELKRKYKFRRVLRSVFPTLRVALIFLPSGTRNAGCALMKNPHWNCSPS